MSSDNKYDRQLRLWGASGQKCISESRVCLLNASATGTETLKNLILPGIGFVCIIDATRVSACDVANNFFVTSADIGRPRGEVRK
jgi:amyloid beta precursor protein binding protein 1